jgi:LuxR family quorum sensing-dependent transcriptional regulator
MDEARDFGLREGLAVAVRLPGGDFASAAMGTEASEISSLDAAAVSFASIVSVTRLAQLIGAGRRQGVELTERQRECLTWVACGKTDWEISRILGLSERTVQEHLGRCVTKLGASNRTHAVAIGVLENRISP